MFQYISFRTAMAVVTSLVISMLFGGKLIDLLRRKQVGETVRDLGLDGQLAKQGTPTMGGIIILSAILIPSILFARLDNVYVLLMLAVTIGLGLVGFVDDYIEVFKKNKEGLAGRFKILVRLHGLIVGITLLCNDGVKIGITLRYILMLMLIVQL